MHGRERDYLDRMRNKAQMTATTIYVYERFGTKVQVNSNDIKILK